LSKHRLVPFGLAAFVAVVLMAVGFAASGAAAPQATFKAGLVSDVGRFNDKGFNQNQLTGMKKAAKVLKIQYRAVESRSAGDYLPNMASLARSGYNIVISAGFLLADATEDVADQFPNTKFAITDMSVAGFKRKHSNIEGLTYATQQNSYLIGQLKLKYQYGEDPSTLWSVPDVYRKLDAATVQQAAKTYLTTSSYVQVVLMPEKK